MSWTVTSSITKALRGRETTRLTVSVAEVKPFVYGNGVLLGVASPSDMITLPEDSGAEHREDSIDVVMRREDMAVGALEIIERDLSSLESALDGIAALEESSSSSSGP